MDRASATETVDLDSIPGRVKDYKISIHNFPAWLLAAQKNSVKPPPSVENGAGGLDSNIQ